MWKSVAFNHKFSTITLSQPCILFVCQQAAAAAAAINAANNKASSSQVVNDCKSTNAAKKTSRGGKAVTLKVTIPEDEDNNAIESTELIKVKDYRNLFIHA